MFIQVIQGRALDPAGIRAEMDRWLAELAPGAQGWLGATSGVTEDGRFISVVRFESQELAQRNSDRPEQGEWWDAASKHMDDVVFHDCPRVRTFKGGGSDRAGFVQVIQAHSDDLARLAAEGMRQEERMIEQAPHILGMTMAEHADREGDFTQTVYFTSEEEARAFERQHPAESDPAFAEIYGLVSEQRYHDLRSPWLDSPDV